MAKNLSLLASLVVATGSHLACGVEVIDDVAAQPGIPGEVQAAFDRSCASEFCHSSTTRAGGVSLAAADAEQVLAMVSRTSPQGLNMVKFGDLAASYLAVKMMAEPPAGVERVGTRMPPLWNDEAEADAAVILAWIESGQSLEGVESGDTGGADVGDVGGGESGGASQCFGPAEGAVPANELVLHDHIVPIIDARCL